MTPDQIAEAVKELVESNGGRLVALTFLTSGEQAVGSHSYELEKAQGLKDALPDTFFSAG